jgi:hypothetical protein
LLLTTLFNPLTGCDDTTSTVDAASSGDGGGGSGSNAPYYGHCPESSEAPSAMTELNHLVITEIAPLKAENRPVWFEIYNLTATPIALNTIQLRAYAVEISQEPNLLMLN